MKNKIHNKMCASLFLSKITKHKKFWDLPRPAECMNACVYNKATSPKQVVRVVAKPAKQYKVGSCSTRLSPSPWYWKKYHVAIRKTQAASNALWLRKEPFKVVDLPGVKIRFIEAHLKAKEFTVKSPTLNMGCVHWESTRCFWIPEQNGS